MAGIMKEIGEEDLQVIGVLPETIGVDLNIKNAVGFTRRFWEKIKKNDSSQIKKKNE